MQGRDAEFNASEPDFVVPPVEKELRDHDEHLGKLLVHVNKCLFLKTWCCYRRSI